MVYLYYIPHGNAQIWYNDEIMYVVQSRNDIPLICVPNEHIDILLSKRCGCYSCGGERPCLRRASLEEITKWHASE